MTDDEIAGAAPAPAGLTDDQVAAAPAEDELAFLKPGYRRPAPGAAPEIDPSQEDKLGAANREYQANVAALPAQIAAIPKPSTSDAVARGITQSATFGIADEIGGAAGALVDTASKGQLLDPSALYRAYVRNRDEIRENNAASKAEHPTAYGGGEITGAIATALIPGMALAKGASALKVGLQGAALGGLSAFGSSNADNAKQLLKDTGEGAVVGGVGGAVLHGAVNKLAEALATKIPALADRQAVAALTDGAPKSLTMPMTGDANLSAALNEPIQVAPRKTVTLGQIAGKSAEEVRPVVKAQQERVGQAIGGLLDKSGKANLSDLASHYDSKIGEYARTPGNAKYINALEDARQEALEHWGPNEQAIEGRKTSVGAKTDQLYDKADAKSGGVTIGDLVAHRDAQIAELSKTPGNQAAIKALQDSKQDVIRSWGTRPVFDPNADVMVDGKNVKAGAEIAKIEKIASGQEPETAAQLRAAADSIRNAASKNSFDPTVKVPSKAVRAYATKLQNEAATDVADPKLAAQARKLLGSSTRDFVNGHVESVLGPGDRKALEGLNGRMSNLYRWPDVVSGKEADPAVRDAVLKEFDQKISPRELDDYASTLEKRGTQRINKLTPGEITDAKESLATATRDFANAHASGSLSPADQAEFQRLADRRASLKNIDNVLERREGSEQAAKTGIVSKGLHAAGGLGAIHQLGTAAMHATAGDIPGAAMHVAGAVGSAVAPHVLTKTLPAAGRAVVRGVARGTDLLAQVVASADKGNPWATRTLNLLRSTPAGAARLAAAIARLNAPGGGATP